MHRNIVKIAGLVLTALLVVMVYQTYIQVFQGQQLLNHPRNRRLQILEEAVHRGRIIDAAGHVVAETVAAGQAKKRRYPFGDMLSNITGYVSGKYGRAGLEAAYNPELLGLRRDYGWDDFWALQRTGPARTGNDIVLSLDIELQKLAYNLMGARKGAVVAIEPSTGRILAMVSRPGYNPEDVEARWADLQGHPDSPLLNRAAQGLYPPGSIMKVITAAGVLSRNPATANRVFDAPGYIVIEGRRIEDSQAKGRFNLTGALARSSNYVFAALGIELGSQAFIKMAQSFGIGRDLPFDLPAEDGRIPAAGTLSRLELGESAIGQGRVMVTPLNMALAAAAVANGGQIMTPSLVDQIRNPDGIVIRSFQPRVLWQPIDGNTSDILRDMMAAAVNRGTGVEADIPGIRVAGKTGSAENPHGPTHAWFIGFAPADNPRVAVAVIVENGGAGGRVAAPLAREIMKAVIGNKR